MDQQVVQPIIDQDTRNILLPAGILGALYLILSGQALTLRIAIGAMMASLTGGYFGTRATAQLFHLGTDWYSILGAGYGFVSYLLLLGVIKLGEAWRADPQGFLTRFLPFMRKG